MLKYVTFFLCLILLISGCKKNETIKNATTAGSYSNLQDFYNESGAQSEYFSFDALSGGKFTTECQNRGSVITRYGLNLIIALQTHAPHRNR